MCGGGGGGGGGGGFVQECCVAERAVISNVKSRCMEGAGTR